MLILTLLAGAPLLLCLAAACLKSLRGGAGLLERGVLLALSSGLFALLCLAPRLSGAGAFAVCAGSWLAAGLVGGFGMFSRRCAKQKNKNAPLYLERAQKEGRGLAVLVLGCRAEKQAYGTLDRRLETALALLTRFPESVCVLSGANSGAGTRTEAAAMRRRLLQRGIAAERLLLEERALNTAQNLQYSAALLAAERKAAGWALVIVSSDYHLPRVAFLQKRQGLAGALAGALTPLPALAPALAREIPAFVKTIIE